MTRGRIGAAWLVLCLVGGAMGCSSTTSPTEAFCREVARLVEVDLQSLDTSAADDPAVRAGLRQTADQFARVSQAAPQDVRPALEVIQGLLGAYLVAVETSDARDPFERSAAILAAQQEFSDSLPGAVDTYTAYVAQHCTPAPTG